MDSRVCRWGILGTAGIARKNWQAIALAGNSRRHGRRQPDASNAAVSSSPSARPPARCRTSPPPLGSYDELLAAVRRRRRLHPAPHRGAKGVGAQGRRRRQARPRARSRWASAPTTCATCSPPATATGVQFMDGVMFMHSRRLAALRQILDDGQSVGRIRRIATQFSFKAPRRIPGREHPSEQPARTARLPGGPRLVHHPLHALGDELRDAHGGHGPHAGRGPPPAGPGRGSVRGFRRDGFRERRVRCLLLLVRDREPAVGERQRHQGLRPCPRLRAPVLRGRAAASTSPTPSSRSAAATSPCDAAPGRWPFPSAATAHATAQETNLFRDFSTLVIEKRRDPHWGEIALKTQVVLDACWQSAREGRSVRVG